LKGVQARHRTGDDGWQTPARDFAIDDKDLTGVAFVRFDNVQIDQQIRFVAAIRLPSPIRLRAIVDVKRDFQVEIIKATGANDLKQAVAIGPTTDARSKQLNF
jgi:hypothetical protein